jgi:hypothetical protein
VLLFLEATKSTAVVFNDGSIASDTLGHGLALWYLAIRGINPFRHG